jgi:hypothetical protein
LAFIVWNLASRSPSRLLRDVANGFRRPGVFLRGVVSFAVGLLLLVGSISVLLPLLLPGKVLAVLVTWSVLTGLLVEQIVGPELYARFLPSGDR